MVPPSSTHGVQPETTPPSSPMTTTGSPGPSSCPDTNMLAQAHTNCGFFTNCSGVQCHSFGRPQTSSLAVDENCADPVLVSLGVDQGSKKFSVGGDGLGSTEIMGYRRIRVEYGRNATHLHFKVCGHACVYVFVCVCVCVCV